MRSSWKPLVALVALAAACWSPTLAVDLPVAPLRALLGALGLFVLPAYLFALATGFDHRTNLAERPALWLVASLGLLLPALAVCAFSHLALAAFLPIHLLIAALLTVVAVLASRRPWPSAHTDSDRNAGNAGAWLVAVVCVMVLTTTALAWKFTSTGSVDRWWYLAYVRSYLDSAALSFEEPFLGTGFVHPRFEFNVWLHAMAAWSQVARVDPVWLYDNACPVLLVPAAFSAAYTFALALFRKRSGAWMTCFACGLLWTSGTLFPIVARIPEDKLLAALVFAPVLAAASIRILDRPSAAWIWTASLAAAVLSCTHALIYAFALVPIVPYMVLNACRRSTSARALILTVAILAAGSIYPIAGGLHARAHLVRDGATLSHIDHPVVRVHRSRGRLLEFRGRNWQGHTPLHDALRGWYIVAPDLLVHPLLLAALAGLLVLKRRSLRERDFLLPATVLPLAIAFLAPLTALAGRVVLPWMVYRILWFIPFALLLGVLLEETSRRLSPRTWIPLALAIGLAVPGWSEAMFSRLRPDRARLAAPSGRSFRDLVDALRKLPADSVIAAAPELSERIPAIAGRRVLAMSDRATVVFAADRAEGEARMRARAAVMAGLWRPREGVRNPTHVLFAPGSRAARYCGRPLLQTQFYRLCEFVPTEPPPGVRMQVSATDADGPQRARLAELLTSGDPWFVAECSPLPAEEAPLLQWPRPGPWSTRTVELACKIYSPDEGGPARLRPRTLEFTPNLGAAVDEFIVTATGRLAGKQRWNVRTRVRARHGEELRFVLPRGEIDTLSFRVIPTLLPFLKLSDLTLTFEDAPRDDEP